VVCVDAFLPFGYLWSKMQRLFPDGSDGMSAGFPSMLDTVDWALEGPLACDNPAPKVLFWLTWSWKQVTMMKRNHRMHTYS